MTLTEYIHYNFMKYYEMIYSPGGYVAVRFIADNPGYWYAHCHIEPHMNTGMTLTIKIGNNEDMVKAPDDFPVCGQYAPAFYKTNSDQCIASQ